MISQYKEIMSEEGTRNFIWWIAIAVLITEVRQSYCRWLPSTVKEVKKTVWCPSSFHLSAHCFLTLLKQSQYFYGNICPSQKVWWLPQLYNNKPWMTAHTGSASIGWLWSTNCDHHNGDFRLPGTRDIYRKAAGAWGFVPFKPNCTRLDYLTRCYAHLDYICCCCASALSIHLAFHGDTHLRVSV